jgi:poly(3-hydroxybutyrate) depolymerase
MSGAMAELTAWNPLVRASFSLLHRITRRYPRPELGIPTETIATRPFCRLVHVLGGTGPRVLICAPLSGHHASLLRDTVSTMLADHDVYLTDWIDAREVPIDAGPFELDDYVDYMRDFIRELGAAELHVLAVCQPTVPVLGAIALAAAAGQPTPLTLTLMGGPIDARRSPTTVNQFAAEHSIDWFAAQMIHRVPAGYPGAGRAVYPGFVQLTAFVLMSSWRHADAYRTYWLDQIAGRDVGAHERFYDDYNAVLDMDAAYYLGTVATVFQEHALARGTLRVRSTLVDPAALGATALMTVEGLRDDITGLGQTEAAHALCPNVPRRDHVVADCGHYGLFSGQRWRTEIYPALHRFIRGVA